MVLSAVDQLFKRKKDSVKVDYDKWADRKGRHQMPRRCPESSLFKERGSPRNSNPRPAVPACGPQSHSLYKGQLAYLIEATINLHTVEAAVGSILGVNFQVNDVDEGN
jgi:hypothetical protein